MSPRYIPYRSPPMILADHEGVSEKYIDIKRYFRLPARICEHLARAGGVCNLVGGAGSHIPALRALLLASAAHATIVHL